MGFGGNSIIEVRSTGSDANGGGFDPTATMATNLAAAPVAQDTGRINS